MQVPFVLSEPLDIKVNIVIQLNYLNLLLCQTALNLVYLVEFLHLLQMLLVTLLIFLFVIAE